VRKRFQNCLGNNHQIINIINVYMRLLVIMILSGWMISCSQYGQEKAAGTSGSNSFEGNGPQITFDKSVHEFNQIVAGEKVSYAFRFTNTGDSPLIITGIRSGCGCTVGDYPKEPLKPGEQGRITVVFNSSGRRGFQSESVNVLNNSDESPIVLRITAQVAEQ
jgi:hypothetical protein